MTRGYTLIEVTVMLLVVGLAAAVVVPSVGRGTEGLRLRADVSGFASFLRYAREQAMSKRVPSEVRIDPAEKVLSLATVRDGEAREGVRASRRLASVRRIEAEPATALTVRFQPSGLSTGGRFRLEGAGGRAYQVTVDPLTGRVTTQAVAS